MSAIDTQLLIVEDEIIVAMDLQRRLEGLGYGVADICVSGEDAYNKARDLRPHLILMDIRLKGRIDGIEAATRIQDETDIPVVFVTAYADEKTLERAKYAAAYGYIVKPFQEHDLRAAIELALYNHRMALTLRRNHDNLRSVLSVQSHGVVVLGSDETIEFINNSARNLLAISSRQVIGRCLSDFLRLSQQDQEKLESIFRRAPGQSEPMYLQLRDSQGRRHQLTLEVKDDPGGGKRRFLYFTDMSTIDTVDDRHDTEPPAHKIVGKSRAIQGVIDLIQEVAPLDTTVLIEGETGTGKELVARAIHDQSPRRAGPFVALNCAGLNEQLAASQLFGHKRGSFTGAIGDQRGVFEAAKGGTLFLDELGELPLSVQGTLLRVLEGKAIVRVGETEPRKVDVRFLAATNRDLAKEAADSRFRIDLFYRVRVARIFVPSLRERREDLPLLARSFLRQYRETTGKTIQTISDVAMQSLLAYTWPGNIRELKNTLEFAFIRCKGPTIDWQDLPPEIQESRLSARKGSIDFAGNDRDIILSALEQTMGNRRRAAKLLGMSRATFYRRLAAYGL